MVPAEPVQDVTWQWWSRDPAGHWDPVPVPRTQRRGETRYQVWFWVAFILSVLALFATLPNFFYSGVAFALVGAAIVCSVAGATSGIRYAIQERG